MRRLTALLVDDEPPARSELRALLAAYPAIEVAGEAEDVAGAVALVRDREPDVVFLDVQLAGETGFDLLGHLAGNTRIVFVTAYDAYAVRAFEVNALDYLLKPVRRQRLAATVERLLRPAGAADGPVAAKLAPDDHIFLELHGGHRFVRVSGVACILAEGNYSRVCLHGGETALVRRPLRAWQDRLPPRLFLRIHRAAIVNLAHVTRLEDAGDGTFLVHLDGRREPLRMSRRRAARVRDRFA